MTGNSSARRQLEEETETEKESIRKCKQEKKSNQIKEKEVRGQGLGGIMKWWEDGGDYFILLLLLSFLLRQITVPSK